jgi:hypothetical protein
MYLNNCKRIQSYADCVQLFHDVPANTRRAGWNENNRPLADIRKHHMRVECKTNPLSGQAFFDVVLYHTSMARFFEPSNDTVDVWYNCDPRHTSQAFNWRVLLHDSRRDYATTDGRRVAAGFNKNALGEFPVRLHFVGGKLDVANSQDAPNVAGKRTSPERKAIRKRFKEWLRTYHAMSKIMDGGVQPINQAEVRAAFERDSEFDPTQLALFIKAYSVEDAVNAFYPLGDVIHYDPSFTEIEQ